MKTQYKYNNELIAYSVGNKFFIFYSTKFRKVKSRHSEIFIIFQAFKSECLNYDVILSSLNGYKIIKAYHLVKAVFGFSFLIFDSSVLV